MNVTIGNHSFNCQHGLHIPQHVIDNLLKSNVDLDSLLTILKSEMTTYTTHKGQFDTGDNIIEYNFELTPNEQQALFEHTDLQT